jgi:hypothetical protein
MRARTLPIILGSTLCSLATAHTVAAEPTATEARATSASPTYDVGFRIGGYGFRREGDGRVGENWTECRMNGFGVFGSRTLTGPLFLEAGLDAYSSAGDTPDGDLPIDRMSGLISTAIGVRTNPASWLRGYVQLGAGVELTRVAVHYGEDRTLRDNKLMPEGFFGVGGDLRIMRGTYVGASLRLHVMGNFDYDPAKLDMASQWVAPPEADTMFDASPDFATQGQFYVRRDL